MVKVGVMAAVVVILGGAAFASGCKKPTDCDVLADMVCSEATPEDCAGARKMAKNATEKEVKACGVFMKMIIESRKMNKAKQDTLKQSPGPAAADVAAKGAASPVQHEVKADPAGNAAAGKVDDGTVKPAENKTPVPAPAEVPGTVVK